MIKDVEILKWIFKSINEIISESPQSNSLFVSLEILEKISSFCVTSTSNEDIDQRIIYEIFLIFEKLIKFDDNDTFIRILNSLKKVIVIFGDKNLAENSSILLNKIVEDLLELCTANSAKMNLPETINKCSLVFKEFSAR
jgi:hypothetical protein